MTNDRISQIEAKFDKRAEIRDAEMGELREALATLAARQGAIESQHEAHAGAIEAIRSIKPPGIIALAGPALAAAVVVGSLGVFVLNQALLPFRAEIDNITTTLTATRTELVGVSRIMGERQDDVRQRLSRLEGAAPLEQYWIKDIDQNGSRKWLGRCERDE
jgi:hypothetical protein